MPGVHLTKATKVYLLVGYLPDYHPDDVLTLNGVSKC